MGYTVEVTLEHKFIQCITVEVEVETDCKETAVAEAKKKAAKDRDSRSGFDADYEGTEVISARAYSPEDKADASYQAMRRHLKKCEIMELPK